MMLKNCQGGGGGGCQRIVKELSRGEFSPGAVPCQSWDLMTRDESLDSASPPLVRIHNHDDRQYCDDHGDQHEDDGNVELLTSHCKNTESDTDICSKRIYLIKNRRTMSWTVTSVRVVAKANHAV